MFRPELVGFVALSSLVYVCNINSLPPRQEAPATRNVHYAGTIAQPAPGGMMTYRISGTWQIDDAGVLRSGTDTVQILDAKVYGVAGTAQVVLRTTCVSIVGKEAWSEAVVIASSNPQQTPIGTLSVTHLSATGGVVRGGGGPKSFWYPTGNACVDRPSAMPAFDMTDGAVFTL